MNQHPLSAAFPSMSSEEFESLKDSIMNIGVQNPITLFEGMVIDGWNRYQAALQVGMACPTVELGDVDPRDFVLAQNRSRRHTSQAQLAMATTTVYAWKPAGNPDFVQLDTEYPIGKTTAELAAIAGVSTPTIKQAKTVQTKAEPEVVEAVRRGDIGLPKAARIAQLPRDEQAAAINKPAPKKAIEDEEYFGPSDEEIAEAQRAEADDISGLRRIAESDDKLAAAVAENERLRAELGAVKAARDGYMNQTNELIRRIKSLKKQLEKAKTEHV